MISDAHGRFHWNELLTRDLEQARRFYTSVMHWEYDRMTGPDGAYYVAFRNNTPVCGIAPMPEELESEMRPFWLSYVEVDDVAAAVAAAIENGGEVIRAPLLIPEVGTIAVLRDPGGALIGWVTPDFDD